MCLLACQLRALHGTLLPDITLTVRMGAPFFNLIEILSLFSINTMLEGDKLEMLIPKISQS